MVIRGADGEPSLGFDGTANWYGILYGFRPAQVHAALPARDDWSAFRGSHWVLSELVAGK